MVIKRDTRGKEKTETSLMGEVGDNFIPEEMMEFDEIVHMPPLKQYTLKVKVKSIKKAEPRIVEP
jgi:hypothetical protein